MNHVCNNNDVSAAEHLPNLIIVRINPHCLYMDIISELTVMKQSIVHYMCHVMDRELPAAVGLQDTLILFDVFS